MTVACPATRHMTRTHHTGTVPGAAGGYAQACKRRKYGTRLQITTNKSSFVFSTPNATWCPPMIDTPSTTGASAHGVAHHHHHRATTTTPIYITHPPRFTHTQQVARMLAWQGTTAQQRAHIVPTAPTLEHANILTRPCCCGCHIGCPGAPESQTCGRWHGSSTNQPLDTRSPTRDFTCRQKSIFELLDGNVCAHSVMSLVMSLEPPRGCPGTGRHGVT